MNAITSVPTRTTAAPLRDAMRVLLVAVICMLGLTVSAPAFAQDDLSDADRAAELYASGAEAYGDERFEEAAAMFTDAYQYDPNPRLAFNAARAYELAEDFESALEYYNIVLDTTDDEELQALATDAAERVEAELEGVAPDVIIPEVIEPVVETGTLFVSTTNRVPGAYATIAGDDTRHSLPIQLPVEPGEYEVTVHGEGHITETQTVTVDADRVSFLELTLDPDNARQPRENREGGGGANIGAIVTMGTGAAALGAGLIFYLQTGSLHEEFVAGGAIDEDLASRGSSARTLSTVMYIVGAAAAAGGLVWYIVGGNGGDSDAEPDLDARGPFQPASTALTLGLDGVNFSVSF